MSFADTYLKRYSTRPVQKLPVPHKDLFLTIVIPVYNEPRLLNSLGFLLDACPPEVSWEIILVINEPADCPHDKHMQNLLSIEEINTLRNNLIRDDLQIHVLYPDVFPRKKAGPGLARKIGMDEAIRRYNFLDRPEGLIVSYDADTHCKENYLVEITNLFKNEPEANGCTIHFEHPLDNIFKGAITQYELYLRYFKMSLEYIGYPYACYSLGSAFVVRAEKYVKAGGMGLQQAGEDFYFLQKCLPFGNFWELNRTSVFPSSRESDRVVFGTGPFIRDFMNSKKQVHQVYPFELFKEIKPIFDWVNTINEFPSSIMELERIISKIPVEIRNKIIESRWVEKIQKAYFDSASLVPFIKKFYHEINLLQIIHLFNLLTEHEFPKRDVAGEYKKLAFKSGLNFEDKNAIELLEIARNMEIAKGNIRIN